jgi:transposase
MQKALVQMNLQLPLVVSDITGGTGLRILRDIVAGHRDPERLAEHRDPRCRASKAEIIAARTPPDALGTGAVAKSTEA